ncbi:hypothetical protein BDN70DRAFT_904407 [Pholiota conissans]|uniref:DUF6593 domain-containing protein n=1 Tax=Pholiota conissans TaxID=109636 RepID=A0A9P5Z7K7_9AGAR|nr:hypothetical protein BDN70DRAFT_904407 [Pholiota conissans]
MPPTFGALPTMENIPASMTFNFVMTNSNILACHVYGPNSTHYFSVNTNATSTTVSRRNGEMFAIIYWQRHATIQASGIIEQQRTAHWIRLSHDKRLVYPSDSLGKYRRRTMVVGGRTYTWTPCGNAICLHGEDTSSAGELARITRANNQVTLQLAMSAFNSGFLEVSVLSTILFLSGRDID